MLTLAACCGGLAWMLGRNEKSAAAEEAEAAAHAAEASDAGAEPPVETLLELEAIELEVGQGLVRLVDREKGGDLLERIAHMRRQIAGELGLIVPPVRIRDNPAAGPSEYVVKFRGMALARGEVYPDQFLAVRRGGASGSRGPIPHAVEQTDPATGVAAYWITEPQRPEADRLRYEVLEAADVLAGHLASLVRRQAPMLLNRQEVRRLLDHLKKTSPALVEEVVGVMETQVKPGELQRVLQNLLREGVPIRDLETILETLGDTVDRTRDIDELTEQCRAALARTLCRLYADETDTLHCVTLDPALEELVYSHLHRGDHGTTSSMPPQAVQSTVRRIGETLAALTSAGRGAAGRSAVVLCAPQIRLAIRRMLEASLPQVAVLGYNEVVPEVRLEAATMIGLDA
jgi:flagellar biosynthesis protein FlhA